MRPISFFALLDSRVKEYCFLAEIDTPTSFLFSGHISAGWDMMTIGSCRGLGHWGTAGSGHSAEAQEQPAREVSYESVGDLAPGLRELLTQHNDTLASAID